MLSLPLYLLMLSSSSLPVDDACSVGSMGDEYVRRPADTWVVAAVTGDSAKAAAHPESVSYQRRDPVGHVVEVRTAMGHGATDLAASGREIAVFTWSVGLSCEWHSRGLDLEPGSTHHFALRLRPPEQWATGGVPTFDELPGLGLQVFPGPGRPAGDITLDEYLGLMELIPTEAEWAGDCRPLVVRIEEWRQDHEGAFGGVAGGLWRYCRLTVQLRAGELLNGGVESLPPAVAEWSQEAGCDIRRQWSDGPYNAAAGRFDRSGVPGWAVFCEEADESRLVVLDDSASRVVTELVRLKGSFQGWRIGVVPPEYFDWVLLGASGDDEDGLPPPLWDAVELWGTLSATFFVRDDHWTGVSNECCIPMALRMPSVEPPGPR